MMRKRVVRALAAILLVASMGAACKTDWSQGTKGPAPMDPASGLQLTAEQRAHLDEAMAECGTDCTPVVFLIDLYDQNQTHVSLAEGIHVEVEMEAFIVDEATTTPLRAPVWNYETNTLAPTPFLYNPPTPWGEVQVAPSNTVQIGMHISLFLLPGWTVKCQALVYGRLISEHSATNNEGILPVDKEVFCSWPLDLPDFGDLDDLPNMY